MAETSNLIAGDVMARGVLSVRPEQSLLDVERMLVEHHITGLPVVRDGHLVGIVSRSDIARVRVLTNTLDGQVTDELQWDDTQADGFAHAKDPDFHGFEQRMTQLKAKDIMRTQVVTCEQATPVAEIADRMVRNHIHRVVVVEGDKPIGIVSSMDLVRLLTGKPRTAAAARK